MPRRYVKSKTTSKTVEYGVMPTGQEVHVRESTRELKEPRPRPPIFGGWRRRKKQVPTQKAEEFAQVLDR